MTLQFIFCTFFFLSVLTWDTIVLADDVVTDPPYITWTIPHPKTTARRTTTTPRTTTTMRKKRQGQ